MATRKFIVALTGGIGSGKTAAADFFANLGVNIIDADIAARKVVEPGSPGLLSIIEHFSTNILDANHALNRQKLRQIIFNDAAELKWLNELMHPLIRNWMDAQTLQSISQYVIKVIPLLAETHAVSSTTSQSQQQFDRILVIDVPTDTQIDRVSIRDKSTRQDVEKILQTQATRKQRLSIADDVISNNSSLADLEIAVKKMHNKYLGLSAHH